MLRAVVRFARDVARLPSFPRESLRHAAAAVSVVRHDEDENEEEEDEDELLSSVLKIVALDPVPGEALPRAESTWFALLPFQDLNDKTLAAETKAELVRARRAFVELLVRLAESGQFRWDAATMHCGDMVGPERSKPPGNAFWFDLLSALWPLAAHDAELPLERHLIAMSRARRPRFVICFDQDLSKGDIFTALEQFLLPPDEDTEPVLFGPDIVDGLPDDDETWEGVEVEIGLSFTRGRMSQTVMTQLLDVIDRIHASRSGEGVWFRVTTLRFGRECTFQANALELLGRHRRRSPNPVRCIRIGSLSDVRTLPKRCFFVDLVRGQACLSRLALSSDDGFVPLASAIRYGGAAHIQELDVCFDATEEFAAWLAFAFFHVDSGSRVSSLCLRVGNDRSSGLSLSWIAAFTRVLQSVRAEHDLAHMEGSTADPIPTPFSQQAILRTFVRLQQGTVSRFSPSKGSKKLCSLGDAPEEEFEVIARFKNALALVLPGAGIGWVSDTSVASERTALSRVTTQDAVSTNQRITSLTVDGGQSHFHREALVKLLEIVGIPLRCLHLPAQRLGDVYLAQILTFCPDLTELNVSGHVIEDITPLREAYLKGTCKIESLSIAQSLYRPIDGGDLTSQMASVLEGGGRHVLRELVMHTLPPVRQLGPNTAWELSIVPFANAVSATSRLGFLHLPGLNLFANGAPQRPPVDFSSRPLSFSPLPLHKKLAFLSVTYRFREVSSLGRLDASVLSIIFRLSYDCTARRVLKDARLAMD